MGFAHAISELRRERETRDRRPDFQVSRTGRRNYEPELEAEVTNRSHEAGSRDELTRGDSTGRSIVPGFPPLPWEAWAPIRAIAARARNPSPQFDARRTPCNAEHSPSS